MFWKNKVSSDRFALRRRRQAIQVIPPGVEPTCRGAACSSSSLVLPLRHLALGQEMGRLCRKLIAVHGGPTIQVSEFAACSCLYFCATGGRQRMAGRESCGFG